jgi:hypothetical protein
MSPVLLARGRRLSASNVPGREHRVPDGESALDGASRELFIALGRSSHIDDSRKVADVKECARGDTHSGECCLGHRVRGGRPMPEQAVPEGRHRRRS